MKRNWPVVLILIIYLTLGALYATQTPRWQVPDEPAHYNYIRTLAQERRLPVMEPQDYDQGYITRLTSERFPPELSVEPLTYEDHQPPLYYLLATPVFWLFDGALLPLRLFSLLLGAGLVALTAAVTADLFPDRPHLIWLTAGLVAFLPQHLAMLAGVNNDALVEVLLALWFWLALRYLRGDVAPTWVGVTLGALLLTKTTGYVALPLSLLLLDLRRRRAGLSWRRTLRQGLRIFGPALLLGSFWWIRNLIVYGWPDVMALQAHNAAVTGQPRTADWIAEQGLLPFLRAALRTTFRSFWGQFGWMGVVLDRRIYVAARILSALMVWGGLWKFRESLKEGLKPRHRDALLLLGGGALVTLTLFVVYNLTFVQHQGRYLYPALPALALAGALGLRQLCERRLAVITALGLVIVILLVAGLGLLRGDLPLWTLAELGSALIIVAIGGLWLRRYALWGGLLLTGMIGLDVWSLFGFIVPLLS